MVWRETERVKERERESTCKLKLEIITFVITLYLSENAFRDASMFFRSEPSWSIVSPLRDIGTLYTIHTTILVVM